MTPGPVTISPAAASNLVFELLPTATTAGATIPAFTVDIVDPFGNLVNSNVPVTLSAGSQGGLNGSTTVQAVGGKATFQGLTLTTAGTISLSASSSGLSAPATTSPVAVSPAAASQLVFEASLPAATAGQALAPFKVDVRDPFGNLVSGAAISVTLTANGPGALGSGAMVQTVGGVATFTTAVLSQPGSYSLTASATGLNAGTSNPFTVSPSTASPGTGNTSAATTSNLGSAAGTGTSSTAGTNVFGGLHLKFLSIPQTVNAGDTVAPIRVELLDVQGKLILRKGIRVELRFRSHGHTLTLPGRSDANGIVTFRGVKLLEPAAYTVRALGKGFHHSEAHKLIVLGLDSRSPNPDP
jgi:hypothetical protein